VKLGHTPTAWTHQQERYAARGQHALSDASQHCASQASTTVRAHHDQISGLGSGLLQDFLHDLSLAYGGFNLYTPTTQLVCRTSEQLSDFVEYDSLRRRHWLRYNPQQRDIGGFACH
jgi:hypothetical protein